MTPSWQEWFLWWRPAGRNMGSQKPVETALVFENDNGSVCMAWESSEVLMQSWLWLSNAEMSRIDRHEAPGIFGVLMRMKWVVIDAARGREAASSWVCPPQHDWKLPDTLDFFNSNYLGKSHVDAELVGDQTTGLNTTPGFAQIIRTPKVSLVLVQLRSSF